MSAPLRWGFDALFGFSFSFSFPLSFSTGSEGWGSWWGMLPKIRIFSERVWKLKLEILLRRPRRGFLLLLVGRSGTCSVLSSGDSRTGVQLKVTCLVAGVGGRGLSLSDWTWWNHDEAIPNERSFMLPSKNLDVLAAWLVLMESLGGSSSSLSCCVSPASSSTASSFSSLSISRPLGPREVFGRSSGSAKVFEGSKIRRGTCPCACFRGCGIG